MLDSGANFRYNGYPMAAAHLQRITNPVPLLPGGTFLSEAPKQLVLESGFEFHHGQRLAPFSIVYETFGKLTADRDNAILVCHALSPGAHAAGKYAPTDPTPGWWDGLIGYGK